MKTALILIQPSMLVCEKKKKEQANYKRSFEEFISKAKNRGAEIICLTYTHRLWMHLLERSDLIFLFPTDRGCMKLKTDENQRGLSEQEKKFLKKKKAGGELQILKQELIENYDTVAENLYSLFSKDGTERVIVCGGMDCKCVYYFIQCMHDKHPNLQIIIASSFLARNRLCDHPLEDQLKAGNIAFELNEGNAETLLKLF